MITKIMTRVVSVLFGSLLLINLVGCSQDVQMSDYVKTVQSGIERLPWPRQMETLFGDGDHFITHYGFDSNPKPWNTEVFFAGRYTLTLQVDVTIDYDRHLVKTNVAPPIFYLNEVAKILRGPKGVEGAEFSGQWILDKSKWEKLVDAKGNWSAIGIDLKTNSPVSGFSDYVQQSRSPRVKIPH